MTLPLVYLVLTHLHPRHWKRWQPGTMDMSSTHVTPRKLGVGSATFARCLSRDDPGGLELHALYSYYGVYYYLTCFRGLSM